MGRKGEEGEMEEKKGGMGRKGEGGEEEGESQNRLKVGDLWVLGPGGGGGGEGGDE